MVTLERINLKPSCCIFNDIKNIDLNLLKYKQKVYKNTDVASHEIKYIIMQNMDNQNIDNELPFCLSLIDIDACIIEENKNKYLIFAFTESNKKMLE